MRFIPVLTKCVKLEDVSLKLPLTSHRNYIDNVVADDEPRTWNSVFFEEFVCGLPPSLEFLTLEVCLVQALAKRRTAAILDIDWTRIALHVTSTCLELQQITIRLVCEHSAVQHCTWPARIRADVASRFSPVFRPRRKCLSRRVQHYQCSKTS